MARARPWSIRVSCLRFLATAQKGSGRGPGDRLGFSEHQPLGVVEGS